MLKYALLALVTATAVTVCVGHGIDLLNQPSTLAVTAGLALIVTASVVCYVVGEYVVNSLTKDKHTDDKDTKNGGTFIG